MSRALVALPLDIPEHVFGVRHSGRVAAAAMGCDEADQVRFATALSELGREAVARGGGATARFAVDPDGALSVAIDGFPRAVLTAPSPNGLEAARKLVEDLVIADGERPDRLVVTVRRPAAGRARPALAEVRNALARTAAPSGPLEQLRTENADLVSTLEQLRAKQDELLRLNAELEDTNRGVMAMYAQLADELEETNRGVVALYAELDDKTVRLNEASEAKSRFLASVSHELRGPVNSVLALARLLLEPDGEPLTDDQRKQLQLMTRTGGELLALVNELLDLAKAESGRLDPAVESVDLPELFGELRGALRPLVRPGVALHVDVPPSLTIETDRTLLTHVLRNLLTNAVKFTTAGSIALRARQTATYAVEIAVADTGIGIARHDHARVFEEFFQVRGALQAEQRGTGLGLPYAKRVTETLGGTLTLESEPGRGSTFTVLLSAVWEPLLAAPSSPVGPPSGDLAVDTVLIVDDDDAFRTVLRGMLQGTAKHVVEASGGVEGLRLLRELKPDVAFIDLRMPDLDGAAVMAEKVADPELSRIPVVIVTATELTVKSQASLGGAAALLAKSAVSRAAVRQAVANACAAPSGP